MILKGTECDERSCQACVAVVRKGKRGYAEACRALAHLTKGKYLDLEKPRSSSSQFLKRAYEEAMYAIEHPEIWDLGPSMDPRPFFYNSLKSLERMAAFIKPIKFLGLLCPC